MSVATNLFNSFDIDEPFFTSPAGAAQYRALPSRNDLEQFAINADACMFGEVANQPFSDFNVLANFTNPIEQIAAAIRDDKPIPYKDEFEAFVNAFQRSMGGRAMAISFVRGGVARMTIHIPEVSNRV